MRLSISLTWVLSYLVCTTFAIPISYINKPLLPGTVITAPLSTVPKLELTQEADRSNSARMIVASSKGLFSSKNQYDVIVSSKSCAESVEIPTSASNSNKDIKAGEFPIENVCKGIHKFQSNGDPSIEVSLLLTVREDELKTIKNLATAKSAPSADSKLLPPGTVLNVELTEFPKLQVREAHRAELAKTIILSTGFSLLSKYYDVVVSSDFCIAQTPWKKKRKGRGESTLKIKDLCKGVHRLTLNSVSSRGFQTIGTLVLSKEEVKSIRNLVKPRDNDWKLISGSEVTNAKHLF